MKWCVLNSYLLFDVHLISSIFNNIILKNILHNNILLNLIKNIIIHLFN